MVLVRQRTLLKASALRYSDVSQSVSDMKRPFSIRTQKPCLSGSWSNPMVIGGPTPVSKLLMEYRTW